MNVCRGSGLTNIPRFPTFVLTIDPSYNQLTHLANDSLGDILQLEILDLSINAISRIDSEAFSWDISVLDLSSNRLSDDSIHDKAFSKMDKLKTLYIQNNHFLHQYPEGVISSLKNLKRLHIEIFSNFEFGEGFSALQSLKNKKKTFYPRNYIHLRNWSFAGLTSQMLSHVYFDLGTGVVPPVEEGSFVGFPRITDMEFSFGGRVSAKDFITHLPKPSNREIDKTMRSIKLRNTKLNSEEIEITHDDL